MIIDQLKETIDLDQVKSVRLTENSCIVSVEDSETKDKLIIQGFQSGPVPGTFTRLRSCIVPAEITEPLKISGGQNHKYDGRLACGIFFIKKLMITSIAEFSHSNRTTASRPS